MKKYIILLLVIVPALFMSCEQTEVQPYDGQPYATIFDPDGWYTGELQSYNRNFIYMDPNKETDTVWVKVAIKAGLPVKDYHISFRQYKDSISGMALLSLPDATPGVQYKAFDDPELKDKYVIHKGLMLDSVPVILLRDPSLKKTGYRITFRMANSEDITASDQTADNAQQHTYVVIYVADCYSEPTSWKYYMSSFGVYGPVKHQFMVEDSKQKWDDDFIKSLDSFDKVYYLYKFRNDLDALNAQREKEGKGPLTEADGSKVYF